jgi:16S rRNA (guanine527-N7)-methyltransferase
VGSPVGNDLGGLETVLTLGEIAVLLKPYVRQLSDGSAGGRANEAVALAEVDWQGVYEKLEVYLHLILKWNARMNLTAIREPEQIVRRHFGESLFAGGYLGRCRTLLDFGSGAGFPGVPMQLMRPDVRVTLAESQGKKAAFLREAVRMLALPSEIWGGRVGEMPAERQFDAVAMRAVDRMGDAVSEGMMRARGRMLILVRLGEYPAFGESFARVETVRLPESDSGILLIAER